jgi:hypothetical protein
MSDRTRLIPVRALLGVAAAATAATVAACGPLPPQAPVAQASTISSAMTTIVATCGESYRRRTFDHNASLVGLESTAASSAHQLAAIAAKHPAWVYQGKTVAQIDLLSADELRGCALSGAARILQPYARS